MSWGPKWPPVFASLHRENGVDLRLGSTPTAADLKDADVTLGAIGVIPDVTLAEGAGLAVDNGVLVDAELRTSDACVFAVGDIANQDHPTLGRRIRVEHWDNAVEQAKVAAHNMLGAHEKYDRQPYFFSDQYELGMEYFGNPGPDGYNRVDIVGPRMCSTETPSEHSGYGVERWSRRCMPTTGMRRMPFGTVSGPNGESSPPSNPHEETPVNLHTIGPREFDFDRQVAVMAVVNRTPDSFHDRGDTFLLNRAVENGLRAVEFGADWVDVGGVPFGRGPAVSTEEEIDRVVPVIAVLTALATTSSSRWTRTRPPSPGLRSRPVPR